MDQRRIRTHCLVIAGILALMGGAALMPSSAQKTSSAEGDAPRIVATYTLPDIPLADWQNSVLPEHPIADDRGLLLGSVGSDLWQGPDDADDEYWLVTDRGPNEEIDIEIDGDEEDRRTFPVPDFTALILHVQAVDGELNVLDAIPIINQKGEPVTGLFNLESADEAPYDLSAMERLPYNPDGIDPEALVRTADGAFWLAGEYRPSLLAVDDSGRVTARYVPEGVSLPGAGYPVHDTLPAIYALRQDNRGFEGLALSGDGQTLYAALQSPLANPDEDAGEESRAGRILAIDTATGDPVAEYVYRFEAAPDFDPELKKKDQDEMKISGLVWLDDTTLLALERSDDVARLYTLDLAGATNILGSAWDDPATSPTLEDLDDPGAAGVRPVTKTLLVDLAALPDVPEKIEGVAVVDDQTVAVVNDNDFALGEFDASGRHEGTGEESRLLVIDAPLP